MNSSADLLILLALLQFPNTSMANALIVFALAGVGVYVVFRALRALPGSRSIDLGAVSSGWIAQHREDPR